MENNNSSEGKILSFTEVRALLPEIAVLMEDLKEHYEISRKLRRKYDRLEQSHLPEKRVLREIDRIESQLMQEYALMEDLAIRIEKLGGIIQSAPEGRVDFISYMGHQRVHLCWQMGEDDIYYWHYPQEPCYKRKPVNPQLFDGGLN